eukprot:4447713-Prorocentrum_lima.AAC.1
MSRRTEGSAVVRAVAKSNTGLVVGVMAGEQDEAGTGTSATGDSGIGPGDADADAVEPGAGNPPPAT